jgi:hypothetical protein
LLLSLEKKHPPKKETDTNYLDSNHVILPAMVYSYARSTMISIKPANKCKRKENDK